MYARYHSVITSYSQVFTRLSTEHSLYSFAIDIYIMGQNQANPFHQAALASDYIIQEKIPQLFLTFLKRKSNGKEYMLRELTFSELREFSGQLERLQKRKKIHHANLTNLEVVEERAEDQMCSSFYKIYALWEYPKKTLIDDIAMRTLENRPYQQQQLWSLVTSCVPALATMQQNSIWHECLTSKAVLFQEDGNIKVADPTSCGLTTNLQYVLSNRYNKSIYLSPEQCDAIANHRPVINKNAYKNDVFTLGMVLLEAGLLQKQDKCFQEDCSVINYAILSRNIGKFGQKYEPQLQRLVELMLDRNVQTRHDWLSLENVLKGSKMKSVGSVTSNQMQNTRISPQINVSSMPRQPVVKAPLPPEAKFHKVYQGIPLSTIHSVSNEGGSSIRQQASRVPSNQGQLYSNISSIPPYSFVSPIAASQNTSNFNQMERSQQVGSNIQPYNASPSMVNPSFLPSHSNLPKSSSAIQSSPNNIRFNSHLPPVTLPPRDMTATFGSTLYQQPPQASFQNERLMNQPSLLLRAQSPAPLRVDNQKIQSIPISLPKQVQTGSAVNLYGKANEPKNTNDSELVQVYEQFSKGSRYKGTKLNGLRHGHGTFYYQDGGHYEGEWKFNRMNGYGKLFYQSEKLAYAGEWMDDQFHGKGKLYNETPQRLAGGFDYRNFDDIDEYWEYYEGHFSQDLKSGTGNLKFSNGEMFQGNFVEDMVQGEGIFSCRDGQRIHAVWMENQLLQML